MVKDCNVSCGEFYLELVGDPAQAGACRVTLIDHCLDAIITGTKLGTEAVATFRNQADYDEALEVMNTWNRIYRAVLRQGKSPDRHLSYHVPNETNSMIRAFPVDNQPRTIRFRRVNPKDVINQMSDSQIKWNEATNDKSELRRFKTYRNRVNQIIEQMHQGEGTEGADDDFDDLD